MNNQELKDLALTRLACLAPTANLNMIENHYNLPRGSIYKALTGKQKMSDRVYTGINRWMRQMYEVTKNPLHHLQTEIK